VEVQDDVAGFDSVDGDLGGRTPPSVAAVTVTSAGSGCADVNSRSSRRCSSTSLSTGKAD
jgi:hypothetical protein